MRITPRGRLSAWAAVGIAIAAGLVCGGGTARAALNVVTTTEDLASIARDVGGQRVSVSFLAHGYEDPHFVDAKPSFILKLKKANVFIEVGRELEIGWVPPLLNNARNASILPGGRGFVDASANVHILEIPTGAVSRALGDVHPYGNPHFWLDPDNAEVIAKEIAEAFARLDPAGGAYYHAQQEAFERAVEAARPRWRAAARALGLDGAKVVTYHNSWPYFAHAFGLDIVGFVEPRPGIPPSASHTAQLEQLMKREGVRVLLVEPYFDQKLPAKISHDTGIPFVMLPPSVDASAGIRSYVQLIDTQLDLLGKALRGGRRG